MTVYFILFLWSFLAATVLPIGSEPMLIGIVRNAPAPLVPVLVATVGNFLGACTLYWTGFHAGAWMERRTKRSVTQARASRLLQRHGRPILILAWVPILGDALVALAGAAKVSFGPFTGWVLTGKALRYLTVAWLALRF